MVSLCVRRASIDRAKSKSLRESMGARGCGGGRRRQSLCISDSRPFHDRINAVCRNILKCLDRAVRPADFDGFHFFGRAQAEVEAQIVLREITSSASDFAELLNACSANRYARADCRAIALCADELEEDAMEAIRVHVFQK